MGEPSLDDALDKLRWAKKHFEVLRSQIEPFEQRDTHTIRLEVDANAGKYEFYVTGLEVADPDWGLMIGDCLHNARTALDYLIVQLWALVTGEDPKDIKIMSFPIFGDQEEFANRTRGLRKQLAFSGYLARIEELQPFNTFNPSVWGVRNAQRPDVPMLPGALDRLGYLDNIDKHRVLHATWLSVQFGSVTPEIPDDFTFLRGLTMIDPLEEDAKVGEWTFQTPLPREWEPSEMEMKRYFPLMVAFPDPSVEQSVLKILPWCIWGVEAVLAIFGPAFEGNPPLPVTAVA